MKRITAFLTAVMMIFTATTQPARAFAPVAVLGAPQIVTAAGSYGIAALAGLVGLVGLYLTIEDTSNNKVRLPLGPNEDKQPPAPTAVATVSPTNTTTTAYTVCSGTMCTASHGDAQSACSEWAAMRDAALCWPLGASGIVNGGTCKVQCNSGSYANYGIGTTQVVTGSSCPAGYVMSGSNCTLENPRWAVDDKTCDILYAQGAFGTANDLNCSETNNGTKLQPMLRQGKAIAYGRNSSGQPLMWEVSPPTAQNPNFTLRQYEQTQTATQTQVTTTEVQLEPQTQKITSVTTSTGPGSLASPTASEVPTADPETAPTQADTPQVKSEAKNDITTCGLPGTPPCAIDDSGFQNRYVPPATSTYNPDLNKQKDLIENIEPPSIGFGWLPSLLPGDAVACHPLEFRGAVNVGEVNLDSTTQLDLCPYLEIARNILGWLFGVVSVIYIWRRVSGARD